MSTFPPGREGPPPIFNGRYELRSQIARGGTAQVYLARDLLLDRPVALKVLFPELSSDSTFVERFRREAQAAANLSHQNIVPVFDWGESDKTYFIVMEHVDGEPLSALIRSQAPLPPLRAVEIAADISKALSYAHRHGVVHRDVKPGNVLITRDGQVKVADFGIARAMGSDESVTQTGLVMGTATYFSPEQAQGLGVDGRSDVYSLGVVLYEMVTGRPPFVADTPVAIAYKHVSESPIPPRELEPRLPATLEAIILRSMAKNPANRYATADDFYADLERFARGEPVLAENAGEAATAMAGAAAATQLQSGVSGGGPPEAIQATPAGAMSGGGRRDSKPEMPKTRWVPWILAAIVLIAACGSLVYSGGRMLGYFGAKPYDRVPFVKGMGTPSAVSALHNAGFVVHETQHWSTSVPTGVVIDTDPVSGQVERQGSTIDLIYSTGLQPVKVPNEVGQTVEAAVKAVKAAGFTPQVKDIVMGPNSSPGVVSVEPLANQFEKLNTVVILEVPSIPGQGTVPKGIYNQTEAIVVQDLAGAGFKVYTVVPTVSQTVPNGEVIKTSPTPGTKTSTGTSITIYESVGKGVVVPMVIGKTQAAATSAISKLGLLPTAVPTLTCSSSQVGDVTAQNPTAQTSVMPNTTVTITICATTSGTTTSTTSPPDTVTVTNPGAQTFTKGQPVSLPITASDNEGKTLTYSATGLPNGLLIDPTTGVISGTPHGPASAPFSVTVTAADPAGTSGSVAFTITLAAA